MCFGAQNANVDAELLGLSSPAADRGIPSPARGLPPGQERNRKHPSMRLLRTTSALFVLVSTIQHSIAAQDSVRAVGSPVSGLDQSVAQLPVDRIADLLGLLPGVASLNDGSLSVRAAGAAGNDAYLDGIPVTPGLRRFSSPLLGGSWFGAPGIGVSVGTNGFDSLTLDKGTGAAEFLSARGGVIRLESRRAPPEGGRHLSASGAWATDALFGTNGGLNFNRVTMAVDGRSGPFSANFAAVAEGQGSERLGMDQNASPIYEAAGVDTVVTVNLAGGGTRSVDVLGFVPSPGIRIPASASSNYSLLGRAGYQLGEHQRVELTAVGSQVQSRVFDYQSLYDPVNLGATRDWSRVVTGSWFGDLARREGLSLSGEAHLSWQTDRVTEGPLDPSGEASSRDPFGGFLLAPLHFRFDANSFPVNDGLVNDFRTNSGRRSPYDLSNTAQYQPISEWRTNAYGLDRGFLESGGPIGRLTLSQEDRVLAKFVVDGRFGTGQRVRVGAEAVRYSINYYSSGLTSQNMSDAYLESPRRLALYGDYQIASGPLIFRAGLRFDHFASGAERPYYFADTLGTLRWYPRISTMSGFNSASPSAPAAGCGTGQGSLPPACLFQYAGLIEDGGHSRLSPRLGISDTVSQHLAVRGSVTWTAQVPDFTAGYQGVNTDINVTGSQQVYGSNVDFERSVVGEIGGRYQFDRRTSLDAAVWTRKDEGALAIRLSTLFDPRSLANTALPVLTNGPDRTATGLDLIAARTLGSQGLAWLAYSYTHSNYFSAPFPETRAHTVTAAVLYQTGSSSQVLGGLLRQVGIYADTRVASGTPYTRCDNGLPVDAGTLSGEGCGGPSPGFDLADLPTLKLLDLRVSKGISFAGATLTAFVDARNLLNTENVTQVFAQTGTTTNPLDHSLNLTGDLQAFAAEASINSLLLSDGSIDLRFGGAAAGGCGTWVDQAGNSATPSCVYLINAERRFGNGDHIFTVAEQTRASDALYQVSRGLQSFTLSGRRVRVGMQIGF